MLTLTCLLIDDLFIFIILLLQNSFCRFLIAALHEANKMNLIEKLQLIVMQFSKFPAGLIDIPCANVFLDKFSDCYIDRQDLSVVTPESDQERELLRVFSSHIHVQCAEALRMWRKNCKDKADYRYSATYITGF